jgi:stage IV sporulation protein FB
MKRLTRIARIDGVDVYFHWSTFAIGGLVLVRSFPQLKVALVAIAAYLGILMIHEWGHVIAARRRRCAAWSIEIYPVYGLTQFSAPRSSFDECVIAWGGVLAQLVVAAPLVAWVTVFGFSASEETNAVLAVLGHCSVLIAILNLLPVRPLDGAKAWAIIPMLVRRAISSHRKQRLQAPAQSPKKKWTH